MNPDLMEYLPPVGQPAAPAHGADKYHGAIAAGYDAKRESDPKWLLEQAIIEGWLGELPAGSKILDVPVGTGRFLACYQDNGFHVVGIDRSEDMLRQAVQKVGDLSPIQLGIGDVTKLNRIPDKVFDAAVSCRVTRWVIGEYGPDGIVAMLRELQRLTKDKIILTARVANHPYAVTLDLIESALDGWAIARNAVGVDMDYRIIMLESIA